jgi:C1A family cysteine protease
MKRLAALCLCIAAFSAAVGQSSFDYSHAPVEQVTGLKPPADLAQAAQKQNLKASQKLMAVGLVATVHDSKGKLLKLNPTDAPLPALCDPKAPNVDFRRTGLVSPIKSQGGCGACWAFATNAVLESA